MQRLIYAIIALISSYVAVTVVRRTPAAKAFVEIEDTTKYRAYLHGFAWVFNNKPHGLYYVSYVNTFPWNKGGRFN